MAEVGIVQVPEATFREIAEKGLENAKIQNTPVQYRVVRQKFENNKYYILLLLPKRFSLDPRSITYPVEELCETPPTIKGETTEPWKIGESKLMIGYAKATNLEIVIPKNGNLTISLKTRAQRVCFAVIDQYGTQLMPTRNPDIKGGRYHRNDGGVKNNLFGDHYKVNGCEWSQTNIFEGSFNYILDAGTYTFRFIRSETGSSEIDLTTQFQSF